MSTSHSLLIYGATGYTGRLLARAAKARGLCPILGGRNERRLAEVAAELGLAYRVAPLDARLDEALHGIQVVLHAAGPFAETSRLMVAACLRVGVHYLDINGEAVSLEGVVAWDAEARQRGVMLMPGVGFDVVPSDCLLAHVARRVRGARRLVLGVSGLELVSRGSFRTFTGGAGRAVHVRRGGALVGIPLGSLLRDFDYGEGARPSVAVGWGDVSAAYYSTGVPDIETYFELTPAVRAMLVAERWLGGWLQTPAVRAWMDLHAQALPDGPTDAERAGRQAILVAEAEDGQGHRARARLRTPEAYTFTCATALAIVERVARGDVEAGFQTPSRVYGPDFILGFDGVSREEL